MADVVPDGSAVHFAAALVRVMRLFQTQLWSMPKPYCGSVTVSRTIFLLNFAYTARPWHTRSGNEICTVTLASATRCVMKETVDRVMKAFATKHKEMTPEQERKVRDEVSDFVAERLAKRADQLTRFPGTRSRETAPN